jgi:crotonobetaine/carnitine-CoA ligase
MTRDPRVLSNLLPGWASTRPEAPWLLTDERAWSFGETHELTETYAAGWQRLGVGRGSRVALFLENSAEYVVLVLSLIRVGAVYIPLNPEFHGPYLAAMLQTLRPDVIVIDCELDEATGAAFEECEPALVVAPSVAGWPDRRYRVALLSDLVIPAGRVSPVDQRSSDVVSILLTSGTTGRSKGVVSSHEAWITGAEVTCRGRAVNQADVFHLCTPMFHAAAWALSVWSSLMVGRPVVIGPRFSSETFWSDVRRHGATQLCTVGPMHLWLWNRPEQPDDADNPARVWTAVPLNGDLWKPFRDRFGLEAVVSMYGQTEVMPATMGDARRTDKPGSSGPAHPDLELCVVDESDHEVPNGSVGELLIRPRRSNVMFEGYLDAIAGSESPDSGWFRTGDLVSLDEDGELYFVERKSDHIRRRGHNVSSAEVESVLGKHPGVLEAAAYAVPSAEGEDDVMIAVVARPGALLDPGELAAFAADRLPSYAAPRYVEVLDELPRSDTGKIAKYLLRKRGVTTDTWRQD